jgi:hypothetical protein
MRVRSCDVSNEFSDRVTPLFKDEGEMRRHLGFLDGADERCEAVVGDKSLQLVRI